MPDSPQAWLSAEQREELLSVTDYQWDDIKSLVDHAAEADRIIAELREECRSLHDYIAKLNDKLATKDAEISEWRELAFETMPGCREVR